MKTIQFLNQVAEFATRMQTQSATVEISSFSMKCPPGRVAFKLVCRPDHLNKIKSMGVYIDFQTAKSVNCGAQSHLYREGREALKSGRYIPYHRFGKTSEPITGYVENWLSFDAICSVNVLNKLRPYVRDNHQACVYIHNDFTLRNAGWEIKDREGRQAHVSGQKNRTAMPRFC